MTAHRSTAVTAARAAVFACIASALTTHAAHADVRHPTPSSNAAKEARSMTSPTDAAPLSAWIAPSHQEVSRRTVPVDGESAELTRY